MLRTIQVLSRFLLSLLVASVVAAISITVALAAAGDLDSSFSDDGKLTTNIGQSYDYASAVAIQVDGKIVVAGGTVFGRHYQFVLARYNADGTLDLSFGGGDGIVITTFTGGSFALDVAIQPDGKIIAVGDAKNTSAFAAARYNTNGTLDPTFGGDGKVTTSLTPFDYEFAGSVGLQADGKIVAAGSALSRFAVVRYNTDGTLDSSFSADGKLTTNFFRNDEFDEGAEALAIQTDGKIVAGGWGGGNVRFALARYNADGSLDSTFSGNGKVVTDLTRGNDYLEDVAIDTDGKIIAAGGASKRFVLLRYNEDGTLDPSFSGDGKKFTSFTPGADAATGVAIQGDGKIVAVGVAGRRNGRFAVARYNTDGSLDPNFGGDGKVMTDFTSGGDYAFDLALQSDGKIVAAGTRGRKFALARYLGG